MESTQMKSWEFSQGELSAIGFELPLPPPEPQEMRIVTYAPLLEKWRPREGQVWTLGCHRIACGDCRDQTIIKLLLQGELYKLCITDPPWNVAYGKNVLSDQREGNHYRPRDRTIENDDMPEAQYLEFTREYIARMKEYAYPGAMVYLIMASMNWPMIDGELRAGGFHWGNTIIWAKDRPVTPSRRDYASRYEAIWYGWDDRKARICPPHDRTYDDVWDIARPRVSYDHPTAKPVEIYMRALKNSSEIGYIVFDPFGGSGPALIAAERLQRYARIIDNDPTNCAIMLQRYEDETGITPVLHG